MFGYWSYRFADGLSRCLPARLAYWVGLRLGDLVFQFNHRQRDAVIANLQQIFKARSIEPASEYVRGTARKTFQYFGKYIVDFFRTAGFNDEEIRRCVSFEHREYLDQALAPGKGVILASAHFGNWEIAGAVLRSMGHELNVVVMPERLRKLETLLESHRRQRGFRIIPLGQAARGILRCLQRGELVAMLADRDFTHHHSEVTFFGRKASMPTGPVRLSFRTGTPLLPALFMRQEDDTFMFRFHPPLLPAQEGSEEAMQRKLCAFLEDNIAERPHQWYLFDHFWKT